jgi:DivIVA domain-containing protein
MAVEEPTDVLPILNNDDRGFDPAIRGYDRAQVDAFLIKLDADLRATQEDRDMIAGRSADIAAQLANAHAQAESLRRQLRAATEQVTPQNVDQHVAAALKTAQTEANRIRVAAQSEAERLRNGAADAAARTTAAATLEAERIVHEATERHIAADTLFRTRMGEIETHKTTVEADLEASVTAVREEEARLTALATAERTRLDGEAEAERNRLNAEATALRNRLNAEATAQREALESASLHARTVADEDFELILRGRRTEQYALLREERTVAEAEAAALIAAAQAEVERLENVHAESHSRLSTLADDLKAALRRASS